METEIVNPVTPDGKVGFDKYKQFCWEHPDEDRTRMIRSFIGDPRGSTCPICLPNLPARLGSNDGVHN